MTQGELERIPQPFVKHISELEERIMEDVVRKIKANGFSSASADWQITRLQQLSESEEEIRKHIREALNATEAELDKIFDDTVYHEYYGHDRAYRLTGMQQIPFEKNQELQQLIQAVRDQTSGAFQNMTASMGFARMDSSGRLQYDILQQFYQGTLDAAIMDIQTGAFDYNTVLNRTIDAMTKSGVRWIDYSSGRRDRVDVAARRAVMTGFRQVQGWMNEQVARELGTDSYEVTYHVGARPAHQPWQGRVWTYHELETVCGLGSITGLHGANCYHDYNAFIPGVSARTYTDTQLDDMILEENTPKEFNGKEYTTYEALQKQRQMERAMRKSRQDIHLLQKGEGDADQITLKKAKYQGQMQTYKDFSKKMKLPEQMDRVYQDGLTERFGLSKVQKKALEEQQKYDIIIKELREAGVKGEIHYPPRDIDTSSLAFDDIHINNQREHNVTEEEARLFIQNAKVSVTVWNGKYERYYGIDGTVYVDLAEGLIRTAYKKEQYSTNVEAILEVIGRYG